MSFFVFRSSGLQSWQVKKIAPKETGFLWQEWWDDRDLLKKPGFWLFFGDMGDRAYSPNMRNRVFFCAWPRIAGKNSKNPVSGGALRKKKETGFLWQEWWGDRDLLKKPGFWLFLGTWAIALKFPVPHGVPHATTDIVAIPQRQSMDSKKLNEVWRWA